MVYRILRRVDKGGPVGALCKFDWLTEEQIQRLVDVGAIAPAKMPPLDVLPGWVRRARHMAKLGITGTGEFLDADSAEVAERLRVKPETVDRWKEEVVQHLTLGQGGALAR